MRLLAGAVATATFSVSILCLTPGLGFSQDVLYDNGPDGNVGYHQVNFGTAVTNSFALDRPATISNVVFTVYDVDDRNVPEFLKWTITDAPFGGTVLGSGFVGLSRLADPYLTRFLFFAWKMGFALPKLTLPAGTYYLQLQDVISRWDTAVFWAETNHGQSEAYFELATPSARKRIEAIPSEAFSVSGRWLQADAR